MKKAEIRTFIGSMAERGDHWTEKQVRTVYGNSSLRSALNDRTQDLEQFCDNLSKIENAGYDLKEVMKKVRD